MMRRTNQLLFAMAIVVFLLGTVQADPVVYQARHDSSPGYESHFTFDFGGGFTETAAITNTEFSLWIDDLVLPSGDARFLSYFQEIDSVNLPDPQGGTTPIPTGQITVEIVGGTSGNGTYNPSTGAFSTSEVYRIHFNGDLSAYGLTAGYVDLPSTSQGTISFENNLGRIQQRWEGSYTFPGSNVSVNYQCAANTVIVPEPASAIGLGVLASIWGLRRSIRVRRP
jgi:hypothetical protein